LPEHLGWLLPTSLPQEIFIHLRFISIANGEPQSQDEGPVIAPIDPPGHWRTSFPPRHSSKGLASSPYLFIIACTNPMCKRLRSKVEFVQDSNINKMFKLAVASSSSAMVIGINVEKKQFMSSRSQRRSSRRSSRSYVFSSWQLGTLV